MIDLPKELLEAQAALNATMQPLPDPDPEITPEMIDVGRAPTEFEQHLMDEARAKRDGMVAAGEPCCINCGWHQVRPAVAHKDPDWFAAHYVQCTWPRLNGLPSSLPKPREAADDPVMQHMQGTSCYMFKPRERTQRKGHETA